MSSVSAATYTASLRSCPSMRGPDAWSGPWNLPHLEGLDRVLDPDVVVADADTALVALADLGRVVLEPPQRLHRQVVGDHHSVPAQPRLAAAGARAAPHAAAG